MNPLPQNPRALDWRVVAAWAAIVIVYVLLRLPGIGVPLDRDEGAFGYMGQLINHGGLPYRDGLDHKPPVAFYINALALHLVPATAQGVHSFLLVYNFLTLICLFYISKLYFESRSAGLWCALAYAVFSASPAIQGFTASTEMWSLLPVSFSLLLALLGVKKHGGVKNGRALMFASGVAGAIACWTKQTAVTSVLFVLVVVSTDLLWSGSRTIRERVSAFFYWIAGAGVLSAGIAIYFFEHGIFSEFIYWCFVYDLSYTAAGSTAGNLSEFVVRLAELGQGDFAVLAIGLGAAISSIVRRKKEGYFAALFLALSFLGTVPGYAYRHYFAQLAPAVALGSGYGLWILIDKVRQDLRTLAGIGAGLAIIAVPVFANDHYFLERDPNAISRIYYGPNPFPESRELAAFVSSETAPDDPILIVGSEPQILFYAQRRSSSLFLMIYPLLNTHSRYKEFQRTMLEDIRKSPPKCIIAVMNVPYSLLWDNRADLDAIHNLEDLAQREYDVDRVMLLSGTAGEWVDPQDARIDADHPFICIFKKKI